MTDFSESQELQVRRHGVLHALIGLAAAALGIAFAERASDSGTWWQFACCAVLLIIAAVHLLSLVDARTPLLLADSLGVRIRMGREWRGLPWSALDQVVVEHRESVLGDGRLVLSPRNLPSALADLDRAMRRQVRWSQRWYGAPLSVPLSWATRTNSPDLVASLRALAEERTEVVLLTGNQRARLDQAPDDTAGYTRDDGLAELADHGPSLDPVHPVDPVDPVDRVDEEIETGRVAAEATVADGGEPDGSEAEPDHSPRVPGQRLPFRLGRLVGFVGRYDDEADDSEAVPGAGVDRGVVTEPLPAAFEPVAPQREPRHALRAEVTRSVAATARVEATSILKQPGPLPLGVARQTGAGLFFDDTDGRTLGSGVREAVQPSALRHRATEPLVADDYLAEPADDPVIGPELAAARTRARLTIDELSERTRIRPHVLESIEVDDFAPCGGDFYARGHLRTLARVLGVDPQGLLATYDERYAHAPINARRVFEAELATGLNGGMRSTRSGPRWSLLVGAVLCLLMVWGVARYLTTTPGQVPAPAPVLSSSAGLSANHVPITSSLTRATTLVLVARRAPSNVVVRDRNGKVLWSGRLASGQKQSLAGLAPFHVTAAKAGSIQVSVAGHPRGRVGHPGRSGSRTYR